MRLGFLKDNESRVSVTPVTLKKYIDANHSVCIEKNAGLISGFTDKSYNHDKILSRKDVINSSDIIVQLGMLSDDKTLKIKENQTLIGVLNTYKNKEQ